MDTPPRFQWKPSGRTPDNREKIRGRFSPNVNLNLRLIHTFTSTVYSTTLATATSYRVDLTCIAYALVKDADAAAKVCRHRREIAGVRDALGLDAIAPSQVAPIAISATADDIVTPEISSSQGEPEAPSFSQWEGRLFFGGLTSLVRTTETITSFSFITSSITKTLSTEFAAAGAITCIPPGYLIC